MEKLEKAGEKEGLVLIRIELIRTGHRNTDRQVEEGMQISLSEARDPDVKSADFETKLAGYTESLRHIKHAVEHKAEHDKFIIEELKKISLKRKRKK